MNEREPMILERQLRERLTLLGKQIGGQNRVFTAYQAVRNRQAGIRANLSRLYQHQPSGWRSVFHIFRTRDSAAGSMDGSAGAPCRKLLCLGTSHPVPRNLGFSLAPKSALDSTAEAMPRAPVWRSVSLARRRQSALSQCTESRTPPVRIRPS